MPTESRPCSIAEAVDYVIDHLGAEVREAFGTLHSSQVTLKFHHGLGTWIRNELLRPTSVELRAECAAIVIAERAARVAADPDLARVAAKFEPLRPPPETDDFSTIILMRVWERLHRAN